jgi:hypothetical protein
MGSILVMAMIELNFSGEVSDFNISTVAVDDKSMISKWLTLFSL